MNEHAKITANHLSRLAIVYLRQSTPEQVEHNRESTDRQYSLVAKVRDLGWPEDRVVVIDEDLGLSGSGVVARSGFDRLTAEVVHCRAGLILGLEVSRLTRNNADWHRLIDMAGLADTLLSPQICPRIPGPLPRWLTGCIYPFLPLSHRPSPKSKRVGLTTKLRSTTSERVVLTRLQSFDNLQASEFAATQVVPTAGT